MKAALTFLILVNCLAGCKNSETAVQPPDRERYKGWIQDSIVRYEDTEAGVVCWTFAYMGSGIDCLPVKDTLLKR